jgi:protease YdgD
LGRRCGTFLGALLLLMTSALPAGADDIEPAIGRLNHAGFSDKMHCTVTLVAPRVALSAWHCVVEDDVAGMHVLLGYDRGEWSEHLRPVAAFPEAPGSDEALLCLTTASTTKPVPIAERPVSPGETVLVIGYGRPTEYIANRTSCRVTQVGQMGLFRLDCPVAPGTSGAPVLRGTDEGYEVVGVISATNTTSSLAYGLAGQDVVGACAAYFEPE